MADPTTTRRTAPAFLCGLVVVLISASLLAAGSATADPSLADKRAQAQRVLAEVQSIDAELGQAAEAWNAANIRLDQIEAEQRANQKLLRLARTNLGAAHKALETRVVAIYTAGGQASTLEMLMGATSLEDFLNRLEAVDRVSQQDAQPATGRQLGIQGANRSKEVLVNRPVPRRCSNGCVLPRMPKLILIDDRAIDEAVHQRLVAAAPELDDDVVDRGGEARVSDQSKPERVPLLVTVWTLAQRNDRVRLKRLQNGRHWLYRYQRTRGR